MNVTFRQLKVFLALAEHGSITAAAHACHVTQPTASMQIKELADAIGLPLHEQVGKRLYLTAAGEALAETALAMTEQWAHFEQTVEAMKGHTRGKLRVALVSTAKYFVPRMLANFCKHYPEIEIAFEVLNRDGVVGRLRRNADDLYIMSTPPEDMDLEKQAFLANPLVIIAPASHRLARRRRLALQDLAEESFVLREPGSGTRMAGDAHFARHRFQPRMRFELGSNEAIKQVVAEGLGLGVISVHAMAADPADEALAVLKVADFPIHSNWWVIHPRGKRLSPIASVFLQHLARYRESHGSHGVVRG
jgi:DNA-binding transcriptional LysR family regulator